MELQKTLVLYRHLVLKQSGGMFPLERVQILLTHLSVAFKGSVPIREGHIRKVELAVDF